MYIAIKGLPNHEIADKLHRSARMVEKYLFRIYEKLGISNRTVLIF
jgi:DNA-binding NarL/FixJ family response regulator